MQFILGILFSFFFLFLTAQNYVPVKETSYNSRLMISREYNKSHSLFVSELKEKYSGKLAKYLVSNFENVSIDFENSLVNGDIFFDQRIENLINSVYSELKTQNPEIPEMRFFISKDEEANAFCMGNYTILINIGIFYYLENEDQLAAIIAHEIAHQILTHSIQHQIMKLDLLHSKQSRRNFKILDRNGGKKQNRAFIDIRGKMYQIAEDSREKEFEADSLGYEIYSNTKYNSVEYLRAFETMYDKETESKKVSEQTYRKYFSTPEVEFKEIWLESQRNSTYDYEDKLPVDKDSLKTHPSMIERVSRLQSTHSELCEPYSKVLPSSNYVSVQEIATYELPSYLFTQKKYARSLYKTLLELQNNSDIAYFEPLFKKNIEALTLAQKSRTFSDHVESMEDEGISMEYKEFLQFLWSLSYKDWDALAEYYSDDNKE